MPHAHAGYGHRMRAGLLMDPNIPTQEQLEAQAPLAGAYVQVRAGHLAEGSCAACVGSMERSLPAQLADNCLQPSQSPTPGPCELTWQQHGLVMHMQCPAFRLAIKNQHICPLLVQKLTAAHIGICDMCKVFKFACRPSTRGADGRICTSCSLLRHVLKTLPLSIMPWPTILTHPWLLYQWQPARQSLGAALL